MSSIPLYEAFRKLGVDKEVAKVVAEAIPDKDTIATKTDLVELKMAILGKIPEGIATKADLYSQGMKLMVWGVATLLAAVAIAARFFD